jgi:LPS-assembly protein
VSLQRQNDCDAARDELVPQKNPGSQNKLQNKLSGSPALHFALCHSGWLRANVTLPQRKFRQQGFRPLAMTSRTRFLITAALVCHLLLALPVVTSQLLFASSASSSLPSAPSAVREQEVTIWAVHQEKDGAVFKLRGEAKIHYGTYILYADSVDYNSDTGESIADGHVVLDGGPNDEHVEATHATYNVRAESGRFEHVVGTTGMRLRGKRMVLTSPNPFAFSGKVVEKTGPDHYLVYDGTITTCELPRPKWEFNAHKIVVEVGGNATINQSTFRIEGIPVFYFPFATHPIEKEPRQSGFLIPNIGSSSIKGTIFGDSFFWAINRSMDLTAGAEYFTRRGWAPQIEFRARPKEDAFVYLNYFGVFDRGIGSPPVDQGGHEVHLDAEDNFAHNFRGVASIDYLSSFVFRLAFNDVFSQAVNSEVKSTAFLSNDTRGFFYNGSIQRYQNFESTTPGDVITILHAPTVESSSVDHEIGRSPFYWSYDVALGGLSRSEPSFRTAPLVGRFDFRPTLSLPLVLHGWSVRPELALRETFYTQQLVPSSGGVGVAESKVIDRKALEGSIEVRPPALERVYDREVWGRKWKHVVEPRVIYRYVTGVDNFAEILRFDERDILSNTSEVEYAVVNRLYSKRVKEKPDDCDATGMASLIIGRPAVASSIPWERQPDRSDVPCQPQPQVREVVTWELAQKYFLDPTFGGALVPGQPNVFTTTADFTGIAFLAEARRLSPLISRLKFQATSRTEAEWAIDYDFKNGRINASTAFVNYRFGSYTIGGGDAFLQAPSTTTPTGQQAFNQFRLLFGYGQPNKRGLSAATNLGFDANLGVLQYSAAQAAYNWDCCGLSVEYRRFALGSVRNENQFRINFALANIGSFGNLRRQEKLF